MRPSRTKLALAIGLILAGIAICVAGVVVGELDDAPGAALIGVVLMLVMVAFGIRTLRRALTGHHSTA